MSNNFRPPLYFDPTLDNTIWANLPDATKNLNVIKFVTDIGKGGSFWKSDGEVWRPIGGSVKLDTFNKYPIIVAPSGSLVAATNSYLFGTAQGNTFLDGQWVYFPDVVLSGVTGGFYFTLPTSTTAGVLMGTRQAYPNNTPDLINQFDVLADSAYTGETAEIVWLQQEMPLNLMGDDGRLIVESAKFKNSATGNTGRTRFGSSLTPASNSPILGIGMSTSGLSQTDRGTLLAKGSNRQVTCAQAFGTFGGSASTAAPLQFSVDTNSPHYIQWTLQNALATNYVGQMAAHLILEK